MIKRRALLVLTAVWLLLTAFAFSALAVGLGDVDVDGDVSSGDARLALRCSVGLERFPVGSLSFYAADVDGNGSVEASDARLILRASVGLENLAEYDAHAGHHRWDGGTVTIPVSCTKDGERVLTCTVCGEKQIEAIPAKGHSPVKDEAVTPGCETAGKTEGSHCAVCGEVLTQGKTIPATGHRWDKGKVTQKATCAAQGVKTFTCTVCGKQRTEAIPAAAHTPVADKAVAPGCETEGKTAGSHCGVCGTVLKTPQTIPATGHRWDKGKVTQKATCAAQGVKTFTCTVCGKQRTEAIPATAHTPVADKAVAPGCETAGKTEGSHCGVCGEVLTAQQTVPAAGHRWNDGKTTVAATCTTRGEKIFRCTVCGEERYEEVPALGHLYVSDEAVAPGCETEGKTAGEHCARCHEVLVAQQRIPAKGHQWNEGSVTRNPSFGAEGVITRRCTVCGSTATETFTYDGSDYKQPAFADGNAVFTVGSPARRIRLKLKEMYRGEAAEALAKSEDPTGQTKTADNSEWQFYVLEVTFVSSDKGPGDAATVRELLNIDALYIDLDGLRYTSTMHYANLGAQYGDYRLNSVTLHPGETGTAVFGVVVRTVDCPYMLRLTGEDGEHYVLLENDHVITEPVVEEKDSAYDILVNYVKDNGTKENGELVVHATQTEWFSWNEAEQTLKFCSRKENEETYYSYSLEMTLREGADSCPVRGMIMPNQTSFTEFRFDVKPSELNAGINDSRSKPEVSLVSGTSMTFPFNFDAPQPDDAPLELYNRFVRVGGFLDGIGIAYKDLGFTSMKNNHASETISGSAAYQKLVNYVRTNGTKKGDIIVCYATSTEWFSWDPLEQELKFCSLRPSDSSDYQSYYLEMTIADGKAQYPVKGRVTLSDSDYTDFEFSIAPSKLHTMTFIYGGRVDPKITGGDTFYELLFNVPNLEDAGGELLLRFSQAEDLLTAAGVTYESLGFTGM